MSEDHYFDLHFEKTNDLQEVPHVCTYLFKQAKLTKAGKQPNIASTLQTEVLLLGDRLHSYSQR